MTETPKSKTVPTNNIIAIASGKGGVGKTFFAVTLSHAFARAGNKTLLFDGDLGLANVDIQLGLMPDRDLGAVLAGKMSMRQAITHYDDGGFDIISGRSGTGSLATLPLPRITRLLSDLTAISQKYDKVIVDLGAGIDRTVQVFAEHAQTCLLVINDEPTSLTDAYAFIKVASAENPNLDVRVVVNAAETKLKGKKTYETLAKACQNFLKINPPLLGIIQQDSRVKEAIRKQVPLLSRSPATPAADDIENIVKTLNR